MFGKAKAHSHEKDEQLPPAPQLQDSTSASLADPDSTEIFCIGRGMTVQAVASTRYDASTSPHMGVAPSGVAR